MYIHLFSIFLFKVLYPSPKRFVGITLSVHQSARPSVSSSVRPFVCLSVVSCPYLSYEETLESITSRKCLRRGCVMIFAPRSLREVQGHWRSVQFVSGLYLCFGQTLEVPTSQKYCL